MSMLRGERLREAVVPGWLVEVVRPRKDPVPWEQMARAAIAVCAPVGVAGLLGEPVFGLLAAMGGLLATVVDRGGAYVARIRRIAVAAVCGGAAGLIIGGLIHGRGWAAVVVIVLLAGISALLSAVSAIWSVTGLQLLVYSSFGLGPLGALRPAWMPPVMLLAGAAWGMALLVPGWVLFPRAGEERRVAGVYRALAGKLAAIGTGAFAEQRRAVTAAMNAAYDEFLTARSGAGGRDRRQVRLIALLNQAHLVAEASTTLGLSNQRPPDALVEATGALADAIRGDGPVPGVPPAPAGAGPGLAALHDGLSGAAALAAGARAPADAQLAGAARSPRRIPELIGKFRGGRLVWVFTIRLMLCMAVAGVVSEVAPIQRSYWVVLTVAIVMKPDFGSVFARAVQRGVGTVIGAVAGAVAVAAIPYGPYLLIPIAVFSALLPYGRSRNYGLFSVFLTPLVVLLIDLLVRGGWRLAETRLIDTAIGCAIVLVLGYAPWPGAWYVDLPRTFADAADEVARYLRRALGEDRAGRMNVRRQTYRRLSDVRAEFQRTMAEPAAASRRATAWWPALVALEQVADAVTAVALAAVRGAPAPSSSAVAAASGGLREVAEAVRAEHRAPAGPRPPAGPRVWPALPPDERLAPVAEAVRAVQGALAGADG